MIFQVGPGDEARHCTHIIVSCGKTFMYFCIIVPAQNREKTRVVYYINIFL